jgi:hypothetical protein
LTTIRITIGLAILALAYTCGASHAQTTPIVYGPQFMADPIDSSAKRQALVAAKVCPNPKVVQARPFHPGVSIGNVQNVFHDASAHPPVICGAGTAGAVVIDRNGQRAILSNNHVLAAHYLPILGILSVH